METRHVRLVGINDLTVRVFTFVGILVGDSSEPSSDESGRWTLTFTWLPVGVLLFIPDTSCLSWNKFGYVNKTLNSKKLTKT